MEGVRGAGQTPPKKLLSFLQHNLFRTLPGTGVQEVLHRDPPLPDRIHYLVIHLVRDSVCLDPDDIRIPDDVGVKCNHIPVDEADIPCQEFFHRLLPHIVPTEDDNPSLHFIGQAYADVIIFAVISGEHDFPKTGEFSPLCGHLFPFGGK